MPVWKTTPTSIPEREECEQRILDVVHSDVWGPAQTATFGGCRYYVTFIDDFSRHTWIFPMPQKSKLFAHFLKFKSEIKRAIDKHVRCLRSDGDKEYFANAFTPYLNNKEFSENYLPKLYWAEATNIVIYLMNRFTTPGVHDVTPYETLYGKKLDLSHVKIFGSIAFVYIPGEKR